jgi:hypothetical protein
MKKPFVLFAGLLLCMSCSKSQEDLSEKNLITYNNFEAADGWGGTNPTLTKEKAHSGRYSIKIDPTNEYSYGFDNLLGKIASKKPKGLKVEAWAFVPSKQAGSAKLVVHITKPTSGQQVIWEGIPLENVENFKEWTEVSKEIKLPANVEVSDRIQIYLWKAGATEAVYIDDLKLSATE